MSIYIYYLYTKADKSTKIVGARQDCLGAITLPNTYQRCKKNKMFGMRHKFLGATLEFFCMNS